MPDGVLANETTIAEAAKLQAELAKAVTALVQDYEATTGLIVHSLPVTEHQAGKPTECRVKVQLP
jgi:predicted kinase